MKKKKKTRKRRQKKKKKKGLTRGATRMGHISRMQSWVDSKFIYSGESKISCVDRYILILIYTF